MAYLLDKYRWILFDADETLFHFDAFAGLQRLFSFYDVNFSTDDFHEYQIKNKPLWVDYQNGAITAAHLQTQRFQIWADKLSVSPLTLNHQFLMAMADICQPLPGAKNLIESLSGRLNLGIITNGFTALQEIRLQRTGFKDDFSVVIISEEFGVAKPDPAIFHHALTQMGQPAVNEVLMVGDTLHSDILGGNNVGFDTCWLNHHSEAHTLDITPTYQIKNLDGLAQLLFSKSLSD